MGTTGLRDLFDQFGKLPVGGWLIQLRFPPFVLHLYLDPAYQCDKSLCLKGPGSLIPMGWVWGKVVVGQKLGQ